MIVDEIIAIIYDLKKISVKEDTALFDEGIIDSFFVFSDLIPVIEERYDIKFQVTDILPENFEAPEKIAGFIERAKERGNYE